MTSTRSTAARASVLVVAAGAFAVLGLSLVSGGQHPAQAERSCARETYMMQYWNMKARLGGAFLFSDSTVSHYNWVGAQHMQWASEVC